MKIQVSEIPDEGLIIEGEEDIEHGTNGIAGKAVLKMRVEKSGSEVRLKGTIRAGLNLECSRCLKPFRSDLSVPVDLVFLPAEDVAGEEGRELASDELNTGFYRGGEIDLGEVSGEQVLLNVSMKPLCSESCRGICPVCGIDLNEGACGCTLKKGDDRMQALKKYFESGKE
jgi:uncharacterized protein